MGRACPAACVKVGAFGGRVAGVAEVGNGIGVLVGGEVGLGRSVGGTEEAVGSAACVSATSVKAAASAVC